MHVKSVGPGRTRDQDRLHGNTQRISTGVDLPANTYLRSFFYPLFVNHRRVPNTSAAVPRCMPFGSPQYSTTQVLRLKFTMYSSGSFDRHLTYAGLTFARRKCLNPPSRSFASAGKQSLQSASDLDLVGVVAAALGDQGAGGSPREFGERLRCQPKLRPGCGDPATRPVIADPDVAEVIRS
jgi:hypothetical protein